MNLKIIQITERSMKYEDSISHFDRKPSDLQCINACHIEILIFFPSY